MEPETKQQIAEHAEILGECLTQMRDNIPEGLLTEKVKLGSEELQAMATSIYIAVTRSGRKGHSSSESESKDEEPSSERNGGGNYDGPASENQVNLVSKLRGEINKLSKDEGDAIVKGFLEDNGAEGVAYLTKSQASSLCTTLIEAKKSMRRK